MNLKRPLLSSCYTQARKLVSKTSPHDFENVVNTGHIWLKRLAFLRSLIYQFPIPKGLTTEMFHLSFPSPLTLAAFEGDIEIINLWMEFGLGGAAFKTVLKDPRQGNPRPRIQKILTPEGEGLINAMGLPGKGLKKFLDDLKYGPCFPSDKPLAISIGGNSVEEYQANIHDTLIFLKEDPIFSKHPVYLEINISCPNTPEGQDMIKYPALLEGLLQFIRHHDSNRVVSIKLSPDQSDESLLNFAELIKPYPFMFINVGNTRFKRCREVRLPDKAISIGGGGQSGPALFPRTLEMVRLLAAQGVPLMATGGIDSTRQVEALRHAGAKLVGMATAVVQDPYRIPLINNSLIGFS
jgi:dihydroorotate dehydrogenase